MTPVVLTPYSVFYLPISILVCECLVFLVNRTVHVTINSRNRESSAADDGRMVASPHLFDNTENNSFLGHRCRMEVLT